MEKLRELRKARRLTTTELANIVGCSNPTITHYERGDRKPDPDMLKKFADYFGVSIDYLLGRENPTPSSSNTSGVKIPVYGEIAAGIPIEAIENIIDFEEITPEMASTGEYIALKVKGSSMEPRIMDGDVVIIRRQENVENGEIAAVMVNGDCATLKRVKLETDGLYLIPLNPGYSPIFYTKKECVDLPIRILGKMIELRAKF